VPLSILAHPHPQALEPALLQAVEALQRSDPCAPLWIVAPTRKLRHRVQALLARESGSRLGIRFFEPPTLASALAPPPIPARRLSPLQARILVRRALALTGRGAGLLRYSTAAGALLPAFHALQEADIEPVPPGKGLPQAAALALDLFPRWRALAGEHGLEDDFDAARRAAGAARRAEAGLPPVLFFGFSELVGRWRRVVRALAESTAVTLFAHAAPPGTSPAHAAAERLLAAFPEAVPSFAGPASPPPPARVAGREVRGPARELEEALTQVLDWVAGGTPLGEIAVIARGLEAYLPYLGPLARRHGLLDPGPQGTPGPARIDSPAALPLLRWPCARKLLNRAEEWPGEEKILGEILSATPGETLQEGLKKAWAMAENAQRLDPQAPPAALLREALELQGVRPFRDPGEGGLALLDFQQARGLSFSKVILLGFHQGGFPRTPGEDGFLPDRVRRLLSRELPDPLPLREDQRADEHLMLALVLRCAREELLVLRQRSDADGRALAPSPAQPALEGFLGRRLAFEPLSSNPFLRARRRLAAGRLTPGEAVLAVAGTHKPLARAADLAARLPALRGTLGPAPGWLQAVESHAPEDLRFDGAVGADRRDLLADLSVTRLEAYGKNPMGFFFEKILKVSPRRGRRLPGPEPSELGSAVHKVLEETYAGFGTLDTEALVEKAQKLFDERVAPLFAGDAGTGPFLAQECARWRAALARFLRWDAERLRNGLSRGNLAGPAWTLEPGNLEREVQGRLDLGPDLRLNLKGKIDRLLTEPGGSRARISDYKTGKVYGRYGAANALQGTGLQNPLYIFLLEMEGSFRGRGWSAETVRIAPDCDYDVSASKGGYASAIKENDWAGLREGIRETAAVLARHLARGHFPPFRAEKEPWDGWFGTMRHGHAPTRDRVEGWAPWRDLFLLMEKKKGKKNGEGRAVLLAEVEALQDAG